MLTEAFPLGCLAINEDDARTFMTAKAIEAGASPAAVKVVVAKFPGE